MKPVIGVTLSIDETNIYSSKWYFKALMAAGAFPFGVCWQEGDLTGYIDTILKTVDGLILSGGGDIHARFYNEELSPKATEVFENRDEFELALCKKALEKDIPLLGICRGEQLLNVALGGSLLQHIENHTHADSRHKAVHEITLVEGTKLHDIFKTKRVGVNSLHHQVVNTVAQPLIVSAKSDDGYIEAIEIPGKKFVLAVQWHPEALSLTENNPEHLRIFNAFIKACT